MDSRYRPDPRHHELGDPFFDVVEPARFPESVLRYRNQRWAERIGLGGLTDEEWIEHFARFRPLPENLREPLALRYHGHQFRTYNPALGDGRGFLFAQLRDPVDDRLLDLTTKGSGRTPWSRTADGRLTLKGGVREVLATELLEALGVYTSKSFSLIETGEALERHDEPSPTRASVLVRLGHGHVRIGSFQRLAALGAREALERLLRYSVETYWPEVDAPDDGACAAGLLRATTSAVATMGAEWTAAGFVHGVLNTDNVMITGESFDYGPWRFLPTLDPGFTAAYFDQGGLYAFGRQPEALEWNLHRFAECLLPFASEAALRDALAGFRSAFQEALVERTLARLGLAGTDAERDAERVDAFYQALRDSQLPFERAFFDLIGGARQARIDASREAAAYRGETWAPAIERLRDAPPAAGVEAARAEAVFQAEAPPTHLIDEVEALWAPIAERDDWGPLEGKLEAIDALRAAYLPLLGERGRRRPPPAASADDRVQ